ncbi:MAG: ATPase [Bacillota bacterium]|nr:ATPase [Bacillota bacterium]
MEILNLLEQLEDTIEEASKVPMSNKAIINKEEVLEIITEIRLNLPDEIKQAAWIKKERQRILEETQSEANKILNDAQDRQSYLIDDHELTKKAEQKAIEIEERAKKKAQEIRSGTYNYCDKLLERTQGSLEEMLEVVVKNRDEVKKI